MRLLLLGLAASGVAGMILTSIADSPDGALVCGLFTLAPTLALLCVTAVTNAGVAAGVDDLALDVEDGVAALVADGADERTIRAVVRAAVRLGRTSARPD
jgi:hypothetical protein